MDKNDKETQEYIIQKEMEELEKDPLESFDDYLEMIITFGYITMFASKIISLCFSCFPLRFKHFSSFHLF